MMTKKSEASSGKERPCCWTNFPETLQCDLDAVGGIKGICKRIPTTKQIAKISMTHHALSDPIRMTIVCLLAIRPLCVCVIRECIGIAGSRLSYHLNIMKENGLIDCEQHGKWSIYQITDKGKKYANEIE